MMEGKRQTTVAAVLLIGFSALVSGQGISPNGSPAVSPEARKSKPARAHGSPKELSIKRSWPKNQNQANTGSSKGDNANVNANTNQVRPSYADALRSYRHHTIVSGGDSTSRSSFSWAAVIIIGTRDIGVRRGVTIPPINLTITTGRFILTAIYCQIR